MDFDIKYMRRALQIATNGLGNASPNPMVGAVITDSNGTIIGEGYHRRCGEGHAEVNAIALVKNIEKLKDATIYVTLEPCSHYGKTPPCAKLIIDNKIPRVVVGCLDPFEKVSGRGVKMLRDAGIEVVTHVLEKECRELNAVFMTAHSQHRPFITLKWAQSNDGFIDHKRDNDNHPARFSTSLTSALVHRLRSIHDAIIVGSNTIITDNPRLDVRLWHGNNPIKIILDRKGNLSYTSTVFNNSNETVIRISDIERDDLPAHVTTIQSKTNLNEILTLLYNQGITSLLVEGGATLLNSFIDNELWDYARIETAPINLKESGTIKAPTINKTPCSIENIDGNKIISYTNNQLVRVKSL